MDVVLPVYTHINHFTAINRKFNFCKLFETCELVMACWARKHPTFHKTCDEMDLAG
jgi:hypothetical protein